MKLLNSNDLQKRVLLINRSVFKGVAHATLVPILIMLLVNIYIDKEYGLLAGTAYLVIPILVYLFAKDKDISKMFFFGTLKMISALVLFIVVNIIT